MGVNIKMKKCMQIIQAPLSGRAVPLAEVPDEVFSQKVLGDGIAIIPENGKVLSPVDGEVATVAETLHAYGFTTEDGLEILVHVGLETVGLEGKPFTVHVQNGDKVKKGQLLIEADLEAIKAAGLPTITPVLICNTDDYPTFKTHVGTAVTNADLVIELGK